MRAAVIANTSAGRQTAQREILEALTARWSEAELFGVQGYGGELLPKTLPEPTAEGYLPRFSEAMAALVAEQPDLLITVGGDGTAAYAADWLLSRKIRLPIFGIGAGTANVGPIVTHRGADALPLPEELTAVSMGAIEALLPDGTHLSYGFNDLVLGNTLLGSVDGQTVTLDAWAMAHHGEKRVCDCLPSIAAEDFRVEKNGQPLKRTYPKVGQIIASTLERESFYGRAVTGVLCFTPDSPFQAAVCLTETPIISYQESPEGFEEWFSCGQLLLQAGDLLEIRGLAPTVCAVADGNPYLLSDGAISLRYVPNLFTVLIRR